jgi:hypothetical protein
MALVGLAMADEPPTNSPTALAAAEVAPVQMAVPSREPPAVRFGVDENGDVRMCADMLAGGGIFKSIGAQIVHDPGETLAYALVTYAGVRAAQGKLDDDLDNLFHAGSDDPDSGADTSAASADTAAGSTSASSTAPPGGTSIVVTGDGNTIVVNGDNAAPAAETP